MQACIFREPLAVDMEEADELVSLIEEKGLRLGGVPDTFMGAGIQTARRLTDDGAIGDVVGANCAMVCHGHETWHPDPEFYYKHGVGPMLDMGVAEPILMPEAIHCCKNGIVTPPKT